MDYPAKVTTRQEVKDVEFVDDNGDIVPAFIENPETEIKTIWVRLERPTNYIYMRYKNIEQNV